MSAYCLFQNLNITNSAKMKEYAEKVKPITESFGGEYVVMSGSTEIKEGDWTPTLPVIIKFPSIDAANEWYNSDEYAPLKALRESAGEFSAVFINGVEK
ncbi:DUF1330 domain-containing protein [Endozoicomonas sp. SM1973]|uniref:DUF1330 domain-containing protein n=1 Tax=Spartinivicinus marinus TaxID=2994442 RepID=A0A853I9R5_9GAMM|nr:DUF1330 domain-containing protein [Spartinivicinus marinus]MCX4028488.1 DUF1330 domain-containing protein [Spartinivicinus marinus]NYZ67398.1 DUF1330 domain-containing protein [Spartinivicinus marinus]